MHARANARLPVCGGGALSAVYRSERLLRISINSFVGLFDDQSVALLTITIRLDRRPHFQQFSLFIVRVFFRPSVRLFVHRLSKAATAPRPPPPHIAIVDSAKKPHSPESKRKGKTVQVESWAEGSNIVPSGPQTRLTKVRKK